MTIDGTLTLPAPHSTRNSSVLAVTPLRCRDTRVAQLAVEAPIAPVRRLLPPALHPVNPAVLVVTAYDSRATDIGPFRLVEVALQCRAGARARRYLLGSAVDSTSARDALSEGWAYEAHAADVDIAVRYERADITVTSPDGRRVLDASVMDLNPVVPTAVAYFAALYLTTFDGALELLQIERDLEIARADRGRPRVDAFDSAWWTGGGSDAIRATAPISASITTGDLDVKPVRFATAPDVPKAQSVRRIDNPGRR